MRRIKFFGTALFLKALIERRESKASSTCVFGRGMPGSVISERLFFAISAADTRGAAVCLVIKYVRLFFDRWCRGQFSAPLDPVEAGITVMTSEHYFGSSSTK